MAELSVQGCVGQLCEAHLGPVQRAYRVQPTITRTVALKRLKRKAYDALFSYQGKRPEDCGGYDDCPSTEIERLLMEVDRLRALRKYKNADRLELLLDNLTSDKYDCLRFLVALKGSGDKQAKPVLGKGAFGIVTSMIRKTGVVSKKPARFTPVPPCYGDTDLTTESSRFFMHYPSEVFETLFAPIEMTHETDLNMLFSMVPGKGLEQGDFLNQKFLLDDQHEQSTHDSLFGGLVQGKAEDLNSFFDLPDISQCSGFRIPEFKAKKSISSSQLSDESGVGSATVSMSSSVMTLPEQTEHDPWFWINALNTPRSYHYTWEWIGYAPEPTEKPHLTEAGPSVFDLMVRHRRRVLSIMCPTEAPTLSALVAVQPKALVRDVLMMLTGVPSPSLPFNSVSLSFQVLDGVHISGTSPEMLSDFLLEFTDCGTFYSRLSKFSQAPVLNSFYTGGLVFQAFTVAVRKALMQFEAAVLNTPTTLGLLQLKVYLHGAMEHIKYLAKLCRCCAGPPRTLSGGRGVVTDRQGGPSGFPTGMNLLSYLYNEASVAVNSSCYPLLLSIFQTTCAPFILFIRDWVFHGVLRDSYEEFMIKVDSSCVTSRDESYWSSAYTLNSLAAVPNFLHGIVEDIVSCGKSINLLRLCSPRHFLCNLSEREVPSVYITYSKEVMQAVDQDCQMYVGRMRQVSRQLMNDRAEMMRKAEAARVELQQIARRMADQEISRLQAIIDERKRKAQEQKRVEFARLKQQMEEDLRRRAGEKQTEKEEEAKLMARITREEDALTEEEIELERRAREELVEYYTSLGEEAAHRERLALWKVQRARLAMKREEFLDRDAQRWGRELKEKLESRERVGSADHNVLGGGDGMLSEQSIRKEDFENSDSNLDIPDSASEQSVALPRWAQRHGGGDAGPPLEVSGDEEVTLPVWAARELPPTIDEEEEGEGMGSDGEDMEAGVRLPNWVLREAYGGDVESPRVVADNDNGAESDSDKATGYASECSNVKDEAKQPVLSKDEALKTDYSSEEATGADCSLGRQLRAVQIGGSPLPKPHIKTSSVAHSSVETEEKEARSSTYTVKGMHATMESSNLNEVKPTIKLVPGSAVDMQSEEVEVRAFVKASDLMSATKESEPSDINTKPLVKYVEGADVNQETTEEREVIPRKAKGQDNISSESLPKVWVIKKPSRFGHASQLSGLEYVLTAPKLKRQGWQHANTESDYKDFGIKPRIRMSKTMSATKQSSELGEQTANGEVSAPAPRSQIRMVEGRNSNVESQRVDENKAARRRFLARNSRGHASDSTVQQLLYGDFRPSHWTTPQPVEEEDAADGPVPKISLTPGQPYRASSFQSEFHYLTEQPNVDLMSDVIVADLGRDLVDSGVASEDDVEAYKYTPLSVLLARSVTTPIKAQISLVNNAEINYFTSELHIDDHFVAIRRYLLMADGDFAEILANILFEKLSTNPLPQEIFNPVFLNGALTKAVRSSIYSDDEHMRNLNFALTRMPSVLMPNAPDSLSCLELRYTVQWPLNVILTKWCMRKYCRIFNFLLQIKRVVWTLKDVWHRLKRDALVVPGAATSPQFRHFQLHRQEMEHFVKAMQGYITSQVIHVSWQEFQTELAQPMAGLTQLQARHQRYLEKATTKCLLNKKAAKVMKVIQDIFCLILKFRSKLVSASWQTSGPREATHPNFEAILQTHKSFHLYSFFLFKVVNRLSQKGYEPHLQELLLQLNFNDFYREAAT